MENFGSQFLHKKDSKLHTSDPVEHEKARLETRGEETSQKPADKISDFLEVLKRTHISHRYNTDVQERIKNYYHREYIIKPEDVPESYFENQRRLARELGHGDVEITDEAREQAISVITTDQKSTLDTWLSYFTSADADSYPMWAKYWAFTNMLKLSSYDKEKHSFGTRDKSTVAPYPDLNREALAYVVDVIVKTANKQKIDDLENNPELKKLLDGTNFGKLYSYALEKTLPTEQNELENTEGEWIKYKKGSDHMPLVKSLQGYGTGWCTAGESTAQAQLQGGDFYVYYSKDKDGNNIIPRVAIRMQDDSIGEVRGIAERQNLDPYIADVAKTKLKTFPDGDQYEKKVSDMKMLTEIEKKTQKVQPLTKDELLFLYEVNGTIEGFGYEKDPRINEIREKRNIKEDLPIIFSCVPNQIATNEKEITKDTKAYIGPLFKGIFQTNIEHIGTSFPEGMIQKMEVKKDKEIISAETAIQKLKAEGHDISGYAKDMLSKVDWKEKLKDSYEIISLSVGDLFGDTTWHTYADIKTKAEENGLDLVPANLAPEIRLSYPKSGEWTRLAMKAIDDRDGPPSLFRCGRDGSRSWLGHDLGRDGSGWNDSSRFFFVRK